MVRKRIIILGAGLAGLSAAWHLQKRGIDCQLFEKEPEVGGLCRSKSIDGFTFDKSGHLLHFKHRHTFNLVNDLLGDNLVKYQRSAWIYSHHRYIRYPFQANLYGLPPRVIKECLLGFIRASCGHLKEKKHLNFFNWINQTFGKGITRYFMLPYNTKFWTIEPKEMTCGWLDGFVPVPSLEQVIEGTVEESKRLFGYNCRFWYPKKGGINQVSLSMASQIKHTYTDCPVTEIDLTKREIKIGSGNRERFDCMISTIPLPEMLHLIKGLPRDVISAFRKLRWNSIFNLNLGIEREDNSGRHWVYFPEGGIRFFRIGFPHNFSSYIAPAGKSSLYIEVAYSKDKPIDKSKIVLRIKEDLKKIGLLKKEERICCQDINDIKYGYPIYDKDYGVVRNKILGLLLKNNIIPCGRYGSWRYMSMEDVLLDGKNIAESHDF
jgi:protoporphyrinogen oxidase